jgi:hypothetical protein
MLTTVKCCVKIQNDSSDPYFETQQGLRQGGVLLTLLFNVLLESIVRRAKLQTHHLQQADTTSIAYIDIVGRSLEAVRDAYLALEAEAGLKINEQKIKYMIATGNRTILDAGQTVAFGDRNFEVEFMYLGALVPPKSDVSLKLQRRI